MTACVRRIGTSISKRHPVRNYGIDFKIDPNLPDKEYTHQAYQEYLKRYLRCVKGVDDNLARLFAYLKKAGPARQHDHHLHERPGHDARRARLHGQTLDV